MKILKTYHKRLVEANIKSQLKISGGILLIGPKWCGKTETAKIFAASIIKLDDPTNNFSSKTLAMLDPATALQGEKPRLVDEWQVVSKLWDGARYYIDQTHETGLYIFTGSSVNESQTLHTGTGRFTTLKMRTMSLFEQGLSNNHISLEKLFANKIVKSVAGKLDLHELIKITIKGGWPNLINKSIKESTFQNINYINNIIENDAKRVCQRNFNKAKFERTLKSLSRNICTQVKLTTLSNDIKSYENENVSDDTISMYLDILNKMYIVEDIPHWAPLKRSKTVLRISPKKIFADPSLAIAALKLTETYLFKDLNFFGFIFENLVIRDLLIYAQYKNYQISFYRDNKDLEIDVIVESENNKYGAIEIKLGTNDIVKAEKNLLAFEAKMISEGNQRPAFLAIIVGIGGILQRKPNGIYIIPIDCLGV